MAIVMLTSIYSDYSASLHTDSKSPFKEYFYFKIKVCCVICNKDFEEEIHCKYHLRQDHMVKNKIKYGPFDKLNKLKMESLWSHSTTAQKLFRKNIGKMKELFYFKITVGCVICSKEFEQEKDFEIHARQNHESEVNEIHEHNKSEANEEGEKEESKSLCEDCGAFVTKSNLYNHIKRHKGTYKCNICGYCAITASTLKLHIERHTGEKSHLCTTCGKTFVVYSALERHIKRVHARQRLKCDVCGKFLNGNEGLRAHKSNVHSEQKYPCEICDKIFTQLYNLKTHMSVHTKEMKFTCENCGKGFRVKCSLLLHQKKCH